VERVDVAIVGAGPAGSTLAALLAPHGLSVLVIDRDRFPRDKVCGEFLSYDALPVAEAVGVLGAIDAAGAPQIEACRIVSTRRTYEFRFPRPARGVSRMLLDDLLLRRAAEAGAQCLEGMSVAGLDRESVTLANGRRIAASAIVGAWGRWGRFDQQLNRRFLQDRGHRNFGFKRHYRGPHPAGVIDLYSFRRGYLGVNAVEGGAVNICGLVHASRLAGHRGRWDGFVEQVRGERPELERLYAAHEPAQEAFLSSEPVVFRARDVVEQGIFTIGDASGVIDPLTGNGMAMAMQSALLLAPHLARLVETPRERTAVEDAYRRDHASFFGTRIAWSRFAARLLSRPAVVGAASTVFRSPAAGTLFLTRTRAADGAVDGLLRAWFR
jgi:flavin-dependent dehydrogenase